MLKKTATGYKKGSVCISSLICFKSNNSSVIFFTPTTHFKIYGSNQLSRIETTGVKNNILCGLVTSCCDKLLVKHSVFSCSYAAFLENDISEIVFCAEAKGHKANYYQHKQWEAALHVDVVCGPKKRSRKRCSHFTHTSCMFVTVLTFFFLSNQMQETLLSSACVTLMKCDVTFYVILPFKKKCGELLLRMDSCLRPHSTERRCTEQKHLSLVSFFLMFYRNLIKYWHLLHLNDTVLTWCWNSTVRWRQQDSLDTKLCFSLSGIFFSAVECLDGSRGLLLFVGQLSKWSISRNVTFFLSVDLWMKCHSLSPFCYPGMNFISVWKSLVKERTLFSCVMQYTSNKCQVWVSAAPTILRLLSSKSHFVGVSWKVVEGRTRGRQRERKRVFITGATVPFSQWDRFYLPLCSLYTYTCNMTAASLSSQPTESIIASAENFRESKIISSSRLCKDDRFLPNVSSRTKKTPKTVTKEPNKLLLNIRQKSFKYAEY